MSDLKVQDIEWHMTVTEECDMQNQVNFSANNPIDRLAMDLLFPFYRKTRDSLSAYMSTKYWEYFQQFSYTANPYLVWKGKKLYVIPFFSGVDELPIRTPDFTDEDIEFIERTYKRYEKIEADLRYLSLYFRTKFAVKRDPKDKISYLYLHHRISPMALKSNNSLMCFLQDNDYVVQTESKTVTTKAENILSFYVGYNLVCST